MGFKRELQDECSYQNGIARFEVELEYAGNVIWRKDQQKIPDNVSILKYERVKMSKTRHALIVKNCNYSDFGTYQVQSGQDVDSEAVLKRSSPFKCAPLDTVEAYPGESATIQTVLHANCYVKWYCAGQLVQNNDKFSVKEKGNTSALIIKNVDEKDLTFYTCESRGETKFIQLAEASPFNGQLEDCFGSVNGIAVFNVRTKRNEHVKWFVGNCEITTEAFSMLKYEIRNNGLNSKLIVKNIKDADFTTFSCQSHGVRQSAQLRQELPFMTPLRDEVAGYPTGIEVLRTKVRPGTWVKWYRGEELITPESFSILKYEQRSSGDWRELVIKNLSSQDAVNFAVEANGIRQVCRVKLAGLFKWTTGAIEASLDDVRKFRTTVRNQQAYLGEIAVFECLLRTNEMPVNWFVNGQHINSRTFSVLKYETRFNDKENRAQLLVKNITHADYAKLIHVTCGNEIHGARLESISPFISEMDNVEGVRGGIEVLKVKTHHNVSVSWYFGSKQINRCAYSILKYESRTVDMKHFTEHHLIVKNITNDDMGIYMAKSKSTSLSAQLNIVEDDKESTTKKASDPFVNKLKHVYAQQDSIEVFEVKTKPGVPLRWYFNNTKIDNASYSLLKYETCQTNFIHRLIVKNITWRDCGVYTVRAYDTYQSAMLKMTDKFENTTTFKRREYEDMLLEKPFKSELKPCGGHGQRSAVYEVEIDPEHACTWYHGDLEIGTAQMSQGKYQVRAYGKHRRLIVNNMRAVDFTSIAVEARGQRLVRFLCDQS